MKSVRIALIATSALLFTAGGSALIACSSDDNTGFPTGNGSNVKDASTGNNSTPDAASTGDDDTTNPDASGGGGDDDTTNQDSGSGDDDTNMDSGSTGTDDGGTKTAADCGVNFKIPSATEKNYCFKANDAGGCSGSTPSCCDTETSGGVFTATCTDDLTGSACPAPSGGKAFFYGCGQKTDCTGSGQSCYIFPYADSDGGSIFIGGTCGYVPLGSGSVCATAAKAPAGSTPTCMTDSDCAGQPNGNTVCNTVSIHSKYFGACTTK